MHGGLFYLVLMVHVENKRNYKFSLYLQNFGICCQQQLGNTMPMPNFGPPVVVLNQELGEFHNNSVNGIFASFAKFLEG